MIRQSVYAGGEGAGSRLAVRSPVRVVRVAGGNVGSYAIQQGTLAASGNYALTYAGANLSITARPITVTAVADNKIYDGTTTATINTGSAGLNGMVNGDPVTLNSSGEAPFWIRCVITAGTAQEYKRVRLNARV